MKSLSERLNELKCDFIIKGEDANYKHIAYKLTKYDHLLRTDLHPSQFIRWDKENNCPLEKPENIDMDDLSNMYEHRKYQQAESEVIFEGFEIVGSKNFISIHFGGFVLIYDKKINTFMKHKTIEDIHKHVELNSNGKKLGGYEN